MRILVVDDSAVDRYLLVSILQEMGHQVDESETTAGLLDKIISGNYEAVFLDIVMPEQDGYKFLREIRTNPKTVKQHVIFCSSKKTPIEVNYGLNRAGADAYITKPVTRENVSEVLEKVPI
ncbi:response regulator [Candidatus Gracilibacteria bacterium]|jgi:twitching motility two-component system response regulator PilH|nr:response regulator [Candidatus Gracilibacteria bacterium]NJM86673.1 response regulator [Hydrococcus sp. RU_2_2]NJP20584.1 response regulator [Hydrococcus sp. CRU_1_1]